MPENEKPRKTWTMYKKALKIEDFTTCPWANLTWTDHDLMNASANSKYGKFILTAEHAVRDTKQCLSNAVKLAGQSYDVGEYCMINQTKSGVILDLPKGVLIYPKQLSWTITTSHSLNGYSDSYIKGYNVETEQWDILGQYLFRVNGGFKTYHTYSLTKENWYNKFQLYINGYDTSNPYIGFKNFGVTLGTIQYK